MYTQGVVKIQPRTYGVNDLLYFSPEFYCSCIFGPHFAHLYISKGPGNFWLSGFLWCKQRTVSKSMLKQKSRVGEYEGSGRVRIRKSQPETAENPDFRFGI